jgi:glutamate/tyrosine decarboxylase-like PLP-dependent enzyme
VSEKEEDQMDKLLNLVKEQSLQYIQEVNSRRILPSKEAINRLSDLDGTLPDQPTDPVEVISMLHQIGSPATVATTGGRYFGFVIGGTLPAALGANWLSAVWDQCAGLHILSPVAAELEKIALKWLLELLNLPATCGGAFTTGATMSSFTALAAARRAVLKEVGWDVDSQGLIGAPDVNVIVSDEVHPTILKALGMLGLGRDRAVKVPTDDQGRMRVDLFPKIKKPAIVCVQAGNVNSGSFDPIKEIINIAHESGAWVHVDGAFGLWAATTPNRSYLVEGVSDADSWSTDGHKYLNVNYDSGIVFVREPKHLKEAMSVSSSYLLASETREPNHYTPELSRRARGVDI